MSHQVIQKKSLKNEMVGFNNLVKIMRGQKIETKIRKKRKKEERPRLQPERELRNIIIRELRRNGIKVRRIENSITGKNNNSIPDLWVANIYKKKAGFMELKSEKGVLSEGQKIFREECINCSVNHWVIRSLDEAKKAIL